MIVQHNENKDATKITDQSLASKENDNEHDTSSDEDEKNKSTFRPR